MVDVRGVIEPESVTGEVMLDGKVLLSPLWLAIHRRADNLVLRQEFHEVLESQKFSWRLMAQMLLDLEGKTIPEWAKLQWVIIDLKDHSVTELRVTQNNHLGPLTFVVAKNEIQPGEFVYGWTSDGNPGVFKTVTAQSEYQFNQCMMKLFGRKFPIKLKSMSPIRGNVTVNVPVEKVGSKGASGSAMAKLQAMRRD